MGNVGVIAFAFGQPEELRPFPVGPSNNMIRKVADQIVAQEEHRGNTVYVAAQWETSGLDASEERTLLVSVRNDPDTHYIDTKGVLDKSMEYFVRRDVERVVLVAHPLHLFFIKFLIMTKIWDAGDLAIDHQYDGMMREVPYDRSKTNVQGWTRGPIRFVGYLAKAFVTKRHGS